MTKKLQRNKKKTIITVAAFVVVILSGLWLVGRYQVSRDAARFHDADQKKQQVFDALVQKIGSPIQKESKNVCHNSEQGPYDDGGLWCYVSSAAYYSEVTDENDIKTYAKDILRQQGLVAQPTSSGDVVFDAAKDITCRLEINDGYSATRPGSFFPDNPNSKLTVIIDCGDRSAGKHYEYLKF